MRTRFGLLLLASLLVAGVARAEESEEAKKPLVVKVQTDEGVPAEEPRTAPEPVPATQPPPAQWRPVASPTSATTPTPVPVKPAEPARQTISATPVPAERAVEEAEAPPPPPAPVEEEKAPPARRSGNMVFLRANPLAVATHGTPLGNDTTAWHPDLVSIGFGGQKLEFFFSLTAQNIVPGPEELGTVYGQLNALYRPIRVAGVPVVDPYVYAGGGWGGGGQWQKAEQNCVDSGVGACGRRWSKWASEAHVGVGLDVNLPVVRFASGQTMYFSVGADIRAVSFFNGAPGRFFNLFVVYSLPVTLRWD